MSMKRLFWNISIFYVLTKRLTLVFKVITTRLFITMHAGC